MSRFSLRLLSVWALCAVLLSLAPRAQAQTPTPVPTSVGSTFIPVSGFFDFVPDTARGMVYFSRGTQVLRWRRSDQTWLAPIELGGSLRALDLSPDGSTLAVADAQGSTLGTPGTVSARVARINLDTLAVSNILYPRMSGETGTYSLAYDSGGNLLISPQPAASHLGPTAFHLWNASTNQTSNFYARWIGGGVDDTPVSHGTAIVANTSRTCLSVVEPNTTAGNWGFYIPGTNTFTRWKGGSGTSGGNYPNERPYGIASDSGSNFFLPTAGALQVRGATGSFVTRYPTPGTNATSPISVALDSSRSLLYLTPSSSAKIEIRDPSNFSLRGTLDAGMVWTTPSSNGGAPYFNSQMRLASDGTLLGARVTDGVRLFTLQNGLPPAPLLVTNSLNTPEDTPVAFTLDSPYRLAAGTTYDPARQPTQGTLTGTGPNYTYTPRSNYNGPDSFLVVVRGASGGSTYADVAVTVVPVNDAPRAFSGSTSTHRNETRRLALGAHDVDYPQGFFNDPNFVFEIVSPPTSGTLVRSPNSPSPFYDYTPTRDFTSDSFTFRAFDGQAYSNVATFSIQNVGPVPIGRDDAFSATLTNSVSIAAPGVLSNDTQSNISTLSAATNVSSGTVSLAQDGSFTWTAGADGPPANGVVTFQYTLRDIYYQGTPPVANVTLRLVPGPVAQAQTLSTPEDRALSVNLSASDATAPTFEVTKNPLQGTLSGTAPDLIYTPRANFNGADSFEFSATEGGQSSTATISITVQPVNDAPVAYGFGATGFEDSPLSFKLNATDVDRDALSFIIVQGPTHGTLVAGTTAGEFTYTPNRDYSGTDSFTWKVSDGKLDSNEISTDLVIKAEDDVPVPQNQSVSTDEDTPVAVVLEASDVDSTELSFRISKAPLHGQLSGQAPNLTYTPTFNFNGSDSFEFVVTDGIGVRYSAPATVSIAVKAVNDAPTAQTQLVTGYEDTNTDITLAGSDAEGDGLTFQITRQPLHGTLKQQGSAVVYRAFDDWNGTDSFGFVTNDGQLNSAEGTVTIVVRAVSDTPVARADSYSTKEDTTLSIAAPGVLANDGDVDGDALRAVLKSQPANGTVTLNADGSFTYKADKDWNGADSFTYAVSDGTLESTAVTVTIGVEAVNDAPVARADELNGSEDTPLVIKASALTANDFDAEGDALTVTSVTAPVHGTLVEQNGDYLYTPAADWNGNDSFTYSLSDGQATASATVVLRIAGVNDAPTALAQSLDLDEDATKAVVLSGDDVDGDALTFKVMRQPANGTLSGTAPNLTYTPNADFNGTDSFEFVANDETADSAPATVTLVVSAVNDTPVALAQGIALDEDTRKQFTLGGADAEGVPLTFKITRAPEHGTLSGTAPNLTFTPDQNWNGTTSLEFSVSDGTLDSAPATVEIRVNAVNDAPVATPQSVQADEDAAKAITLSGSDIDGDALTFAVTTPPTNGALSGTAPNVTYTPRKDWSGSDSFGFSVADPSGLTSSAVISVSVKPVNDAPVASPLSIQTTLNTAKSFSVVGNASDVDGDALTFALKTAPANGTVTNNGNGNFTYTPRSLFLGNDSFGISATDASGASAIIQVSVSVMALNRAPSTQGSNFVVAEDGSLTFNLTATDLDGDALTYFVVQNPQFGTVTAKGGASFTFVPPANYFGTQTFTFQVRDAKGATSNISTVSLQTVAVNDAPSYDLATTSITIVKNSSVFQQSGFARNLNMGGLPYEQGQTITFSLATSNTSLFDQQPGISSDGTLTFRPRNGRTGTATITINARDNGGTSNGGKDTAVVRTFTITIR